MILIISETTLYMFEGIDRWPCVGGHGANNLNIGALKVACSSTEQNLLKSTIGKTNSFAIAWRQNVAQRSQGHSGALQCLPVSRRNCDKKNRQDSVMKI